MNSLESSYKIRGTKVTSPYPVQLTPAETRLIFSLQHIFSPENIFADCYFPKVDFRHRLAYDCEAANFDLAALRSLPGSEVVQIDCIALDQRGIFVFESKDYGGWIYGSSDQRFWTQTLNFGQEKHSFYNPVRQNATHIAALAGLFSPGVPIYSIIVFGSDTTLKSIHNLPKHCFVTTQPALRSLLNKIPSSSPLSEPEVATARASLAAARLLPTALTRAEHVASLHSSPQA